MNRPPKRLVEKWDRILAEEGLPSDASLRHWTFRGGVDPELNDRNRPHRSLDAIGNLLSEMQVFLGATEDGNPIRVHDLAGAEFWRVVGHHANNLPPRFPNRKFLVAVANTGNLGGTAKKFRLAKRKSEWVWRRFLVDVCDLPPPPTTVPRKHVAESVEPESDPFEVRTPVRKLSRKEIAALTYAPPEKKAP